jgi:hypothetical protein
VHVPETHILHHPTLAVPELQHVQHSPTPLLRTLKLAHVFHTLLADLVDSYDSAASTDTIAIHGSTRAEHSDERDPKSRVRAAVSVE